tara:strand:- start:177 stop:428 length:252 start_codon:yes stop_codon:yes gene_type:complete
MDLSFQNAFNFLWCGIGGSEKALFHRKWFDLSDCSTFLVCTRPTIVSWTSAYMWEGSAWLIGVMGMYQFAIGVIRVKHELRIA